MSAPRRWLRQAYDWTLHWAETPNALAALFLIAVAESSVFPIPPDVLLIAIVAARAEWWLHAAAVCTVGSVLGAGLGWVIGAAFMATLGQPIVDFYGAQAHWERVVEFYTGVWGIWFLAAATFTPIPFKIATIAAGATQMAFWPFIGVCVIGRGIRFFLVAAILRLFGGPVRRTLEQHFDAAALIFLALLLGGFFVVSAL